MKQSRSVPLLVVLAILISSSGSAVMTAAAAQPDIQISPVTPSDPAPGESVTVKTTISNLQSSNGTVEITDIYLRKSGSADEYRRIEDVGSVAPGGTVTIPMSVTFEDTGGKQLTAHVVVKDSNGDHHSYEYPVYVTVEEPDDAQLSFATASGDSSRDVVAGATTSVNVTVANSHNQSIKGVQLNLNGSGTVENAERVKGSIQSGAEATFQYDVTFDKVGTQMLTGEVTYRTAEGVKRTSTATTDINVVEPAVRAGLSTSPASNQSGGTQVELTNFGNAELSDIEITATTNGDVIARNLLADIDPDSSRSVTFDIPTSADGAITYTATYEAAGSTHETTITDQTDISGEIRLTGVDSTRTGSGITLEGDAANIGSTDAESVLPSIQNTDEVNPVAPSGEYFVGSVEASEFATFELTATTQSNVSSIPVEITYIVGGDRVTTTQQIDLASTNMSVSSDTGQAGGGGGQGPPDAPGGGLLSILPIVLGVILIGAVGFGVYRWRQHS